jgi:hypothetical protein
MKILVFDDEVLICDTLCGVLKESNDDADLPGVSRSSRSCGEQRWRAE